MKKTHYAALGEPAPCCGTGYLMTDGNITSHPAEVTCKKCLVKIGLRKPRARKAKR